MVYTNLGKGGVRDFLGNLDPSPPNFMAIGSLGSPTATVADTSLNSELDRNAFTSTDNTVTRKVIFQGDWSSLDPSGSVPVAEMGIFAGSPGSMYTHHTFNSFTKNSTVELQVTSQWEVV